MSLEFVLVLPMVAILLVGVLQLVGLARDVLVVQDLARQAARVAATTGDHAAVVGVVTARLPDARVNIAPPWRATGDQVVVTVHLDLDLAIRGLTVTGRGAAMVEPGVS